MASGLTIPANFLCVPGEDRAAIVSAFASGARAVVLDLAVGGDGDGEVRIAAREAVAHFLGNHDGRGPELWVRIGAGDEGLDDIALVVPEAGDVLAGIFVPDVLDTIDLDAVGRELELAEAAGGREERPVPVCALLATAAAVLDAREIAEHERVTFVGLDEPGLAEDLGVDLRVRDDPMYVDPLQFARAMLVLASAAGRRAKPVSWCPLLPLVLDSLAVWVTELHRFGFGGYAVEWAPDIVELRE